MSSFVGKTGIVVRKVERAERNLIDELGRYGVATVHEALGTRGPRLIWWQFAFVVSSG